MIRSPEFVSTALLGQEFLLFHPTDRSRLNNHQFGRDDWRSEINLQLDDQTFVPIEADAIWQPHGPYQLVLGYKSFTEKDGYQQPRRCILNRMAYIRLQIKLPQTVGAVSIFEARPDDKKLLQGMIGFDKFSPEIPIPLISEEQLMQTTGLFFIPTPILLS